MVAELLGNEVGGIGEFVRDGGRKRVGRRRMVFYPGTSLRALAVRPCVTFDGIVCPWTLHKRATVQGKFVCFILSSSWSQVIVVLRFTVFADGEGDDRYCSVSGEAVSFCCISRPVWNRSTISVWCSGHARTAAAPLWTGIRGWFRLYGAR